MLKPLWFSGISGSVEFQIFRCEPRGGNPVQQRHFQVLGVRKGASASEARHRVWGLLYPSEFCCLYLGPQTGPIKKEIRPTILGPYPMLRVRVGCTMG